MCLSHIYHLFFWRFPDNSHLAVFAHGHYFIGTDNGGFSLLFDELKYLWAPWRMGYIRTSKNEFGPCLFCDKSHIGKDEDDLVVHRGENAYIIMNLYL